LYVVSPNIGGPIALYPSSVSGTAAPTAAVTGTYLNLPGYVTADSAGTFYVSDQETVYAYAKGTTSPARTITSTSLTGEVRGMTTDASHNLYVAGGVFAGGVTTYGVAVFAPNAGTNATPLETFTSTSLAFPYGVAVDAAGNIYVASDNQSGGYNAVLEFAKGAIGVATPTRMISGAATGLGQGELAGIALDPSANIYCTVLADAYNPTDHIVEFAASTASGNQPFTRELTGAATGLHGPTTLAIYGGNLFVGNASTMGPSQLFDVTVYPTSANGNQAPLRSIFPDDSGLNLEGSEIAVGP
jgi:hypothetical protein